VCKYKFIFSLQGYTTTCRSKSSRHIVAHSPVGTTKISQKWAAELSDDLQDAYNFYTCNNYNFFYNIAYFFYHIALYSCFFSFRIIINKVVRFVSDKTASGNIYHGYIK
jgi:hypothetical protein